DITRGELDELGRTPLFVDLQPEELAVLTHQARLQSAPARTRLFREGQRPEVLHVLLSGSVQLSAAAAPASARAGDARETIIEFVTAPDSFILAAVLTDTPYLMSATVLESARLLPLPAAELRRDLAGHPGLALTLLATQAVQSRRMV